MIPNRFVTEYPQRCLALLDAMEPIAREQDMLGSFALMAAASVLVIPWERLANHHPMNGEQGSDLSVALRRIERQRWLRAEFWRGDVPNDWRLSRIVNDPNEVTHWRDADGVPSMSEAANTINQRRATIVFRTMRNALAHGNIVYLNKSGHETAGTRLHYIGFLSRYEESEEQRAASTTYRILAVPEEGFLQFVRAWASWISQFSGDIELGEVA